MALNRSLGRAAANAQGRRHCLCQARHSIGTCGLTRSASYKTARRIRPPRSPTCRALGSVVLSAGIKDSEEPLHCRGWTLVKDALLWTVNPGSPSPRRPAGPYQGPTWFWVSVNCGVKFPTDAHTLKMNWNSTHGGPAGEEEAGPEHGGGLKLLGFIPTSASGSSLCLFSPWCKGR